MTRIMFSWKYSKYLQVQETPCRRQLKQPMTAVFEKSASLKDRQNPRKIPTESLFLV